MDEYSQNAQCHAESGRLRGGCARRPGLRMSLTPLVLTDLTAKAKIRHVALGLFAKKGFAGTSLRLVAQRAGVSPALIAHHYGSKEGLRVAVDMAVMKSLQDAVGHLDYSAEGAQDATGRFVGALNRVVFGSPDIRSYIRRSFIEDAMSGRATLLDDLLAMIAQTLDRMQAAAIIVAADDPTWRAMQVLLVVFGPTIFEPALLARIPDLFSQRAVDARLRANVSLFERGLLA
jgi:AcrR family transcriptional regulator